MERGTIINRVNLEKMLSRGRNSEVFWAEAICPKSNRSVKKCAIKLCATREISPVTHALVQVFHPNIEHIYGIRVYDSWAITFCRLCDKNFSRYDPHVDPPLEVLARDLLDGLAFLHDRGIAHCDIKGNNIMLDADKRLIIIDLNNAQFERDFGAYPLPTTIEERHLDLFFNAKDWNFKVDTWASATVIYYIVTKTALLGNMLKRIGRKLDYTVDKYPLEEKVNLEREKDLMLNTLYFGQDRYSPAYGKVFQVINFFLKCPRATQQALKDYCAQFLTSTPSPEKCQSR